MVYTCTSGLQPQQQQHRCFNPAPTALATTTICLTGAVLQGCMAVDVGPHGQNCVRIEVVDRHVGLGLWWGVECGAGQQGT